MNIFTEMELTHFVQKPWEVSRALYTDLRRWLFDRGYLVSLDHYAFKVAKEVSSKPISVSVMSVRPVTEGFPGRKLEGNFQEIFGDPSTDKEVDERLADSAFPPGSIIFVDRSFLAGKYSPYLAGLRGPLYIYVKGLSTTEVYWECPHTCLLEITGQASFATLTLLLRELFPVIEEPKEVMKC